METEPREDRTRTWGIVLMGLLSAILTVVLIKTRAPENPAAQASPSPKSVQGAAPQPTQRAPDSSSQESGAYYRGWPLFEGWPLPQMPSGTGGSGPQPGQDQRPSPQAPADAGSAPPAPTPPHP
jgi:hypothetical protein